MFAHCVCLVNWHWLKVNKDNYTAQLQYDDFEQSSTPTNHCSFHPPMPTYVCMYAMPDESCDGRNGAVK